MDREPAKRIALAVLPGGHGTGGGTDGGEPQPAPVPRAGTEAGTGDDVRSGTGALPVLPAVTGTATPITMPERVGTAVRQFPGVVVKAAGELWLYPDRLLHSFARPEPETMKEHWAHVRSREWVPEELTGTPEKVVTALGLFHHLVVAYPVKAAAKAAKFTAAKVDELADRPLRLLSLLVFLAILIVLFIL